MSNAAPREEIEIKLRVSDAAAIRARLKRLRAREISPRTYESNTLYDTPRQDLRRRGQIIRIRMETPARGSGRERPRPNGAAILTFKGPPLSSHNAKKSGGESKARKYFKVREEAEVTVAGASEMARILGALGLRPAFRYEKFRTTFALPGIRHLKIELDETPVRIFLELEGPVADIDRDASRLGYARNDYTTDTYASLYLADCLRRSRKPGDMLFPPTKKLR
jgi:adenylate cyclase class 2